MIRIINGTYGYRNPETGAVEAKTAKSKPFSIDADRERELVAAGVAEYAGEDIDQEPDNKKQADDVNASKEKKDEVPKYSTKDTVQRLTEIAEKYGAKVKEGATKKEIVAAIDAAIAGEAGEDIDQDEHDDQDDDDDMAPDLSAAMPE